MCVFLSYQPLGGEGGGEGGVGWGGVGVIKTMYMMTSSNGSIFRVTVWPLCGGFPGHRWIPRKKVTGKFPAQRPVTRSFDVLFDLHLNKRLSKQSSRRWFATPSRPLWRHCNVLLSVYKSSKCHLTIRHITSLYHISWVSAQLLPAKYEYDLNDLTNM